MIPSSHNDSFSMCALPEMSEYVAFSSEKGLHVCDTRYGTLQASSVLQEGTALSSYCDLKSFVWDDESYLISASTSMSTTQSGEKIFTVMYKILPYALPTLSLLSALGMGSKQPILETETDDGPWAHLCSLTSTAEFEVEFKTRVLTPELSIPQQWIGKLARHVTNSEMFSESILVYLLKTGNMSASDGFIPRLLKISDIRFELAI